MIDRIITVNFIVPITKDDCVHLVRIDERTGAVSDDVSVAKV